MALQQNSAYDAQSIVSVLIDGQQISNWTPVIIRGGVFSIPISFFNDAGAEPTLSAKIVITPNGSAEIEWTAGNGLFAHIGVGEYVTALSEAYTEALDWDSGRYRIEIVDSSGFTVPCVTDGLIFVRDC